MTHASESTRTNATTDAAVPTASTERPPSHAELQRDAEVQGRIPLPNRLGELWTDAFGVAATRALQAVILLLLGGLVIWGLLQVSIIVIPVLLALIIASAIAPVIAWLGRRGLPRTLSTVIVFVGAVVVFGGLIWLVVEQVRMQWDELVRTTTEGVGQLVAGWNKTFPQFPINDEAMGQALTAIQDGAKNISFGSVSSGIASGLSAFGSFVTSLVLFLVVLFFFTKDGPTLWSFVIRPLRAAQHRRAELMGVRAVAVMGGYVRGTVIVALVDAVFIGIGLFIVGVPLALPLSVVVFILAFIPVVGATLAGVIAAAVTLVTNGPTEAVIVAVIVLVVNQLEGNLLQPVVLGRSLKLHELVVLLALMTGTVLGGIIGTLLSVPLMAIVWALVKAWNETLPELERDADGDGVADADRDAGGDTTVGAESGAKTADA
ncbi:AI-2E family transporter [Gulosibacter bifidus]|uniref:AI-2E family transporter n=1 Tax=Gulosibacter bifidus TaxID=272239 RepID=A0ABW5RKM1_9MICO|nr:AI-2E family transporter [Gulosibacter bifidus]